MASIQSLASKRPAEATTGLSAAVAAIIVATTGASTPAAGAIVLIVGALPTIVTSIIGVTRSTATGVMLVSMTPQVRALASSTLGAAAAPDVSLTDKTNALKTVADAMASWSSVLAAESGTSAASKAAAAGK